MTRTERQTPKDVQRFLTPGTYIDSDHPAVREAAGRIAPDAEGTDKARALYEWVRDSIGYCSIPPGRRISMGDYLRDLETYRASSVLAEGHGFCVSKASLFTAMCRASGIPARPAFADVVNHHYSGRRIRGATGTNVFAWHGFTEVWLNGSWVTLTPMFDKALCARLGVDPVAFDEERGALLPQTDRRGAAFFSYAASHGSFHDVPAGYIATEIPGRYPGLDDYRQVSDSRTGPPPASEG
ncbi:transglutaminase-like domain-containing protein [Streptomyces sp. NBC_01304]|uniref:transglutaminase-like domain-containing protein n=1 Tax=Streptomyces sp. NBC_01304 TaxID=2903818 RepID=UPI002E1299A0|nr:transglutaminase-like domain-containing protein [Streptomyces sp. NBC_01304]